MQLATDCRSLADAYLQLAEWLLEGEVEAVDLSPLTTQGELPLVRRTACGVTQSGIHPNTLFSVATHAAVMLRREGSMFKSVIGGKTWLLHGALVV